MEMRFCHMCGSKLQENSKFCGKCGTPVLQAAVDVPAPQPVVSEPQVVVVPEPQPVAPEPAVVIPEPEPVIPEPLPVEPEPAPVIPEPEPEPVMPEPEPEIPEPAPVEPEPEPVIPEPTPVEPEPVPVIPEPVHVVPQPVPPRPPVPQPEPAAPAKKKKDPYPSRGVGRTILATLLCILIFFWSFAALIIYDVRQATTGEKLTENLNEAIEDVDLAQIPAADLIQDVEDPEISVVEWAIQQITDNYDGTVEFSDDDLEEFLEKATFNEFITQKASTYVDDLYNNTGDSSLTREEIVNLLNENAPLVEEVFGTPMREEDIEAFADEIEELGVMEYLETKTLEDTSAPVYYGVQFGLSYWVVGFFAVLAVLFMLLLAKTNKWNMLRTSGDIGITMTVLGALLTVAALFAKVVPDVWNSIFGSIDFIGSLSGSILFGGLIPALIVMGVGVLLILIQVIGKLIVVKSARKQV